MTDVANGGLLAAQLPATGSQTFAAGGSSGGYTFQYSNLTDRRRALLIGTNYLGQGGQLRGCIDDVKNMSAFLNENYGYQRAEMLILTDDQQNTMSQPTKQNIVRAMHWLVKDARSSDSLFFHYTGHGRQEEPADEDGDHDEVIYPVDFRQVGHICDYEMHKITVEPLQPGFRLTAIFDSSHSAATLDLPYIYTTSGIPKEPNLAKEARSNLMGYFKKATTGDNAYQKGWAAKTSGADVVMWSSTNKNQSSSALPFSLFASLQTKAMQTKHQ